MTELKTAINRSDGVIPSQNKVMNHYAVQLQSAVVSTDHKKAILREMQLELTAQHYRRPEHRSVAYEVTHSSSVKLEMSSQPSLIQTGGQVSAPSSKTAVDNSYIKTQRSTEYIRTSRLTYSDSVKEVFKVSENLEEKILEANKLWRKKVKARAIGIKQRGLENQKYTTAETDSEGSEAIEMVKTVQSAGSTVVQTGGMLRTAVKSTSNGIGSIKTMVKNGVKLGSRKDISRIVTSARSGVANIARDTGQQLLKTQIDKSKITDTGTETIKQGLTELRYVDNARKAVLNTARTIVKAGYAVKNMPKDTKAQVKRIRKNAERTAKVAKKTAEIIKKIFTSKTGLIILGVIAALLLIIIILTGLVSVIVALVSSLFSWLSSPETEKKDEIEVLNDYKVAIVEYVEERQEEVDEIVDGFVCDRISYPPYSEISELNQYGNDEIIVDKHNEIIAILAVLRYRELGGETTEIEFNFTGEEIQAVVDKFFTFEYYYTYAHCNGGNCKKKVTRTVYNQGTPNEYVVVTTTYYCDVEHQWLNGEVTNHTLEEVLASYNFSDEEKNLYNMYLEQINKMLGGG
ncbi:hypothetical protein [Ruminococcus sp. AM31-15AC]|uniref:hypothetical protein n=1 Tax=Ruminococcus sp. AM31-15AC TaxID=2293202 RepID=UPI000E553429|nr:hypothetical protein DW793_10170 [Ruminococcus sp. AM31-15AC]